MSMIITGDLFLMGEATSIIFNAGSSDTMVFQNYKQDDTRPSFSVDGLIHREQGSDEGSFWV